MSPILNNDFIMSRKLGRAREEAPKLDGLRKAQRREKPKSLVLKVARKS